MEWSAQGLVKATGVVVFATETRLPQCESLSSTLCRLMPHTDPEARELAERRRPIT